MNELDCRGRNNFTIMANSTPDTSHIIQPPVPTEMDKFRFILNTCVIGILILFGLVSNSLSFIVLFCHRHWTSTTLVLKALAVSDSLILMSNLFLMTLRYIYQYTGYAMTYMMAFPYVFRVVYPCLYIVRAWTTWFTVLLTMDRYSVVCKPLHAPTLCTRYRTYRYLFLVVVASVAYSIPRFFEYYIELDRYEYAHYQRSSLIKNRLYTLMYRILLFAVVMYIVPISVLAYCNTKLILTLRRAQRSRSRMTPIPMRRDITSLVVVVVIVFIVCNLPAFVAHMLWALEENFPSLTFLKQYRVYVSHVSNCLVTMNSAVNFLIYCLCSASFRETLRTTLRRWITCRCKKKRGMGSTFTSVWYRQNSCSLSNSRNTSM